MAYATAVAIRQEQQAARARRVGGSLQYPVDLLGPSEVLERESPTLTVTPAFVQPRDVGMSQRRKDLALASHAFGQADAVRRMSAARADGPF